MVSVVQALAIVAFAYTLAQAITRIIDGAGFDQVLESLTYFALAALIRGLSLLALDALAIRAGARSKKQLREALLAALAMRGARWLATTSTVPLATMMGSGLDSLDKYFGKYLPQLVLSAVVTPIVVVVLYSQDLFSGIAVTVTLPLIPLFMALVGWATQAVQQQQWQALQGLTHGFLDTVEGLATLKIFCREHHQRERIASLTEEYRERTMKVLRVSFLSAFVLELAASLSVAIVAVAIGLRLLDGAMPLSLGLFVLILVPEVFLPLRAVGAQYHAAAEGLEVAQDVFEILDGAELSPLTTELVISAPEKIQLVDFQPLRDGRVVCEPVCAEIAVGEIVSFSGPSGAGKSSLADALLGWCDYRGEIRADGVEITPAQLHQHLAWTPQSPQLGYGSVLDNVALGEGAANPQLATQALSLAGLEGLDLSLPLLVEGVGLSGGQSHRVGLARSYYRALSKNCRFLVLDEVTASLDPATEATVLAGVAEMVALGHGVLMISHRSAVVTHATTQVDITAIAAEVGA